MSALAWPHHLSAFRLDQFLVGELASSAAEEVRAHLAACAGCASAAAAQRPGEPLPRLRIASGRRSWALATGASALAAAASLVLLVQPAGERSKGHGPSLAMYVLHGSEVRRAGPGEVVRAGDSVRFAATSRSPAWLAVLSVDPRGAASIYFPAGERAQAISPGTDVALPIATRLDETVGEERIVALFCSRAIELQPVRDGLARGEANFPAGCEVVRWSFDKR